MGARITDRCQQMDKLQKLKNLLYVVLVGKTFHLITNIYIRVQFLFSKRGGGRGGVLLLGSVLLLGHKRYA